MARSAERCLASSHPTIEVRAAALVRHRPRQREAAGAAVQGRLRQTPRDQGAVDRAEPATGSPCPPSPSRRSGLTGRGRSAEKLAAGPTHARTMAWRSPTRLATRSTRPPSRPPPSEREGGPAERELRVRARFLERVLHPAEGGRPRCPEAPQRRTRSARGQSSLSRPRRSAAPGLLAAFGLAGVCAALLRGRGRVAPPSVGGHGLVA